MSERDQYPPGVPCWVDTAQPDVDAALGFYATVFGWEFVGPGPMPGDPPGRYYVARCGGRDVAGVCSQPTSATTAWTTHVSVASADAAARRAIEHGGRVLVPPVDAPPAGRLAILADPAGAIFSAWEPDERQGAQRINEPSAWAMSRLNSGDTEASRRFYASLFGWQAEPLSLGDVTVWLFRLPGYVGGEPQQPVPRDLVAVMAEVPAQMPAHWGVDFWIDDADQGASRAVAAGGTVLAGPFDVPMFRTAVLKDPQGATFSISQLALAG